MPAEQQPFADLPAALVEEVIGQTTEIGDTLLETFKKVKEDQAAYRKSLDDAGLIQHESSLGYPPSPTTCATDGSYAIERLLTVDLVAAAAVAVEGLTPPSENRHWDQPHHIAYVKSEVHDPETATILRALMLGNELILATKAPHDLVMIDGTLTLPIIYLNQALNKAPVTPALNCSHDFVEDSCNYLEAYRSILSGERSDKHYIGLPKYSTRREIGEILGWPGHHDDRGILTLLLQAGEFTNPVPLEQPSQQWHLNLNRLPQEFRGRAKEHAESIVRGLTDVHVFYYKPHAWLPALRVEMSREIAKNNYRLATVVQGLKHQCATASMLEPYPIYLADRMVKSLARAIPAFRQVTTQRISEKYTGEIGEVFFAMHGYRSESGA